jgi:hypothetical protein
MKEFMLLFRGDYKAVPQDSPEAQIGLSLRILCGFGIQEIADAFLTNKETINKRLYRAKEKLREEKVKIELPGATEIDERLEAVLTTISSIPCFGCFCVRRCTCLPATRCCCSLIGDARVGRRTRSRSSTSKASKPFTLLSAWLNRNAGGAIWSAARRFTCRCEARRCRPWRRPSVVTRGETMYWMGWRPTSENFPPLRGAARCTARWMASLIATNCVLRPLTWSSYVRL